MHGETVKFKKKKYHVVYCLIRDFRSVRSSAN